MPLAHENFSPVISPS